MKLGFKIWLMIVVVFLSLIAIFGMPPKFLEKGVIVTNIDTTSNLYSAGLRQGDVIKEINSVKINSPPEYYSTFSNISFNGDTRFEFKVKSKSQLNSYVVLLNESPDISVKKIPATNLKLGLDLAGGSRALVKAENRTLTSEELTDLVDITANRLNSFGLTDMVVRKKTDLYGNNFMEIEMAGASTKDLKKLISEQGKFEAKIGNNTVFEGGKRDIASVGRDAANARIESCGVSGSGYVCRFSFTVTLSPEAAKKHAELTKNLSVNRTAQGNYLSEKLDLILDDNLLDSLLISEDLKGSETTQISISGSGVGKTKEDAYNSAKEEMKKLQTILMTGSLPYKLEIVKLDTISPTLGEEFTTQILITGLLAMLIIALVMFIGYRNIKISGLLIIVVLSEVIITLGVTTIIGSSLDLLAIAGVLATFGTGVDDQIVMLDESRNKKNEALTMKQRIKNAFKVIMGAYFTVLASLLPLFWAGAGLLKGFAITTIVGISAGVFITRPAFGEMLKRFMKN